MRHVNITPFVYALFLVLSMVLSAVPIALGWKLYNAQDYASFHSMLSDNLTSWSYMVRVVSSNLDYLHFSLPSLLASLVRNISIINGCVLACVLYLWAAAKETCLTPYNVVWKGLCTLYIVVYTIMAITIIGGFSITTLNAIMTLFQYAGVIMMVGHSVIVLASMYYLYSFIMNERASR